MCSYVFASHLHWFWMLYGVELLCWVPTRSSSPIASITQNGKSTWVGALSWGFWLSCFSNHKWKQEPHSNYCLMNEGLNTALLLYFNDYNTLKMGSGMWSRKFSRFWYFNILIYIFWRNCYMVFAKQVSAASRRFLGIPFSWSWRLDSLVILKKPQWL